MFGLGGLSLLNSELYEILPISHNLIHLRVV